MNTTPSPTRGKRLLRGASGAFVALALVLTPTAAFADGSDLVPDGANWSIFSGGLGTLVLFVGGALFAFAGALALVAALWNLVFIVLGLFGEKSDKIGKRGRNMGVAFAIFLISGGIGSTLFQAFTNRDYAVLQVIINVIDHEMNVAEAVAAPRMHNQWLPDDARFENGFPPAVLDELEALIPLAPLHQPHNVAAMRALAEVYPELPHFALDDVAGLADFLLARKGEL